MIKKKISLHDIVNVGLQELQESLKLFERQTLLMFIENVGSVFPHYYFFLSLGEQTYFTTLRFGLSGLGEKYNWSLLQGLSRAGGNDFRPKDLYFQLPLKKKKLFFSLISMWRTVPRTLVFSALLQQFSMMLIKCNIIYWALFC